MSTPSLVPCVGLLLSLCAGSFAQSAPDQPPAEPTTKLVVVQLPLPGAKDQTQIAQLPQEVEQLLESNWTITQTTELDKASDGSHAAVLLTLVHQNRPRDLVMGNHLPMLMPGMRLPPGMGAGDATAPGAATPAAPAVKQTLTLHWQDGGSSSVVIGDAIGVRSKAHVTTKDEHGAPAADYDATAFNDHDGNLVIDGRGAAMTKSEPGYSPDSMVIHPDGRIEIQDDNGTHDAAHLDSGMTPPPGPGASPSDQPQAPAPPAPSAPKGERQL